MGFLGKSELAALLRAPNRTHHSGWRDYLLILFLARTGARVSEATGVNFEDLRLDRPSQVLVRGNGRKERIVPLDEATATALRALIKERGVHASSGDAVFVNNRGQRLTRFGVIHLLRKYRRAAMASVPTLGNRSVSPHTLRHTAAMNLLQAGVDLTTIQSWLGHASVDTTHQYVEADIEMKRRALQQCEPGGGASMRYRPTDKILDTGRRASARSREMK